MIRPARKKTFKVSKPLRPSQDVEVSALVSSGRISSPAENYNLASLISDIALTTPDFDTKILHAIKQLAMYHPDVSLAVENIITLGNTEYTVVFDDDVPSELQEEMVTRLKHKAKSWYSYAGGVRSLVSDLLGQSAIAGAISAEAIPNSDLSGIEKIVLVDPENIQFKYDNSTYSYLPKQVSTTGGFITGGTYINLNPNTYSYIAIRRYSEKPYAIPPFLAALNDISVGQYMSNNLKHIVKKLGMLGFLEVLINGPRKNPSESQTEYETRTREYLERVTPEIDKGLSSGYVAGFKDQHEFKMQPTMNNAQGTSQLFDINDKKTMAGLKQDPLMFGRNFSTTETLARVILAKMTTQITNYQTVIASFLEQVFLLDLKLAGYPIKFLDVEFREPMIGDEVRKQEAYGKKLRSLGELFTWGIIDINQFSVEAGYEKAADPDKSNYVVMVNGTAQGVVPKIEQNAKEDVTDTIDQALSQLRYDYPMFPYAEKGCCGHDHACDVTSFSDDPETLDDFIAAYYSETRDNYSDAIDKATRKLGTALTQLGQGASEQAVADVVYATLLTNWGTAFTRPQRRIIRKFVSAAYRFFRGDTSIFKDPNNPSVPKGAFNTIDVKAIDYFRKLDELYLGKFITDNDVRKDLTAFIKDQVLNRNIPLDNNAELLRQFKASLKNRLMLKDWKMLQIISTTVSRMRSTAALNFMQQAEVQQYEIVEVNDSKTCAYCRAMHGKVLSLTTAMNNVQSMVSSDPQIVKADVPFITSVFKNAEDMQNLTGDQLQARGIHANPFHPHCRGTVVAVL